MLLFCFQNMSMVEPGNCWDGITANDVEGDEDFENILSILDFPMESLEGDGYVGDWDGSKSPFLGPIPSNVLMDPPMLPHPKTDTGPPYLGPVALFSATPEQKQVPVDIKELASSRISQQNKFIEVQESSVFQTQSPVSVLESSGSCSAAKTLPIKPDATVPVRTRSKRARPMGPNPWLLPSPSFFDTVCKKMSTARKNKGKRKKIVQNSSHASLDYSELQNGSSNRPVVTKKCTHCEVTKTPQWREGPLGPKTLCNACGVRYRSGRLFPEYRPAASPTFVPSLHSNSHKKVIEMRNKGNERVAKTEIPPGSPQPEFISMSSYLFDLI